MRSALGNFNWNSVGTTAMLARSKDARTRQGDGALPAPRCQAMLTSLTSPLPDSR